MDVMGLTRSWTDSQTETRTDKRIDNPMEGPPQTDEKAIDITWKDPSPFIGHCKFGD